MSETIVYGNVNAPDPRVSKFYFCRPDKEAELIAFCEGDEIREFLDSEYPGVRAYFWTVKAPGLLLLYVGLSDDGAGWTGLTPFTSDLLLPDQPTVEFLPKAIVVPEQDVLV